MPPLPTNPRFKRALERTWRALARVRLGVLAEMHYQVLLDNLHEGVIFIDGRGMALQCNPAAERILEIRAGDIVGRPTVDPGYFYALKEDGGIYSDEEHPSRVALRTGKPCLGLIQGLPRAGGRIRWISVNAIPLCGPGGEISGVVASLVDITPMKELQDHLQAEATRDALTGLGNRRAYLEALTKAFHGARRHGHPMSVAFCDLDHLKALNDAHGHAAGDRAIQAFGHAVAGALRREDLAARFGGDEFCVLFTHVGAIEARVCLDRVLEQVRCLALDLPDGARLEGFTASMGLAELGPNHIHPDDLLAAADHALYRAKEAGRDRLMVD
ncbi:MAG TPA: diguanylate cyclase [Holophagaceae bacterium]|nr:diguanylate cyclase [Holophagaceae bacterium]